MLYGFCEKRSMVDKNLGKEIHKMSMWLSQAKDDKGNFGTID